MANTSNTPKLNERHYLDQAGLTAYWNNIREYYKNAAMYSEEVGNAVTADKLSLDSNHSRKIKLTSTTSDNVLSATSSDWDASADLTIDVAVKKASTTQDGLLSKEDYERLSQLKDIYKISNEETGFTDGLQLDETTHTLNLNLSKYALKENLTTVFRFKGTVANKDALPTTNNTVGDVYHTADTHTEYVWVEGDSTDKGTTSDDAEPGNSSTTYDHSGAHWEELGVNVDLSPYATRTWVDTYYAQKPATITAGNLLKVDEKGNLVDTGYAASKLGTGVVEENNTDLVTGNTVWAAMNEKSYDDHTYTFADQTTHNLGKGAEGTFTVTEKVMVGKDVTSTKNVTVYTNAQENVIETAQVKLGDGTDYKDLTVTNKVIQIDLSPYAYDANITAIPTEEINKMFTSTT